MSKPPHLRVVPPAPLTPRQAVVERVKRMDRPDGALQCPRCGGRSYLMVYSGGRIDRGRIQPGTRVAAYICETCYRCEGLEISILPPDIKPAK